MVCAVATALRNLAIDQRNKELIGKSFTLVAGSNPCAIYWMDMIFIAEFYFLEYYQKIFFCNKMQKYFVSANENV